MTLGKLSKLALGLFFLTLAGNVMAEEKSASTSTSKMKTSETAISAQKQKDIDEEITNARLRASTGSKSKISIQTEFAYSGGSVEKPFGKIRPRLSAGVVTPLNTKLAGNISAKYRMDDTNNLNLGSGLGMVKPGTDEQQGQLENPYLSYGRVFKVRGLQNVLSFGLTKYTDKESVNDDKLNYELSFSHTVLGELPGSKWQLGLVFSVDHELYSEMPVYNNLETHIAAGLYPFAEYAFNDVYSFRTVYRGMTFYSTRDDFNIYKWSEATHSMGLGMALTRDIYLYPNIQWVWRDIRSDKTNVALSANINFF